MHNPVCSMTCCLLLAIRLFPKHHPPCNIHKIPPVARYIAASPEHTHPHGERVFLPHISSEQFPGLYSHASDNSKAKSTPSKSAPHVRQRRAIGISPTSQFVARNRSAHTISSSSFDSAPANSTVTVPFAEVISSPVATSRTLTLPAASRRAIRLRGRLTVRGISNS